MADEAQELVRESVPEDKPQVLVQVRGGSVVDFVDLYNVRVGRSPMFVGADTAKALVAHRTVDGELLVEKVSSKGATR